MVDWFEDLPERCPESGAVSPNGEKFFRLVCGDIVTDEDFWSHRKLWPHKAFNTDECKARAVSVFRNIANCQRLLLLPIHSEKKIATLSLPDDAGLIKRTFNTSGHYSWWRRQDFDPVASASILLDGADNA